MANDWPAATSVPLTSFTSSGSGLSEPLTIPSADQTPDVYEVNADLIDTATDTTIGSTCATYSVGMPGDTLNLNTLASGLGSGGPAPVRGVELASEFGTNLFREQLDTSTLLPSCVSPYTDTTTCGPSALDFSSYDSAIGQAAAEAAALGVTFEVQVAQGSALEKGLVTSGLWQSRRPGHCHSLRHVCPGPDVLRGVERTQRHMGLGLDLRERSAGPLLRRHPGRQRGDGSP